MSITKHIPNTLTCTNLLCGIAGIIAAFSLRFDIAFLCMIIGGAMDFLDGFAARALKAYSEIGKQLDSLCDLVTFGVLPALILNRAMLSLTWSDSIVCYTPLLIAVFAALRLAKFNTDSEQSEQFKGLATPAAALICGALGYYVVVEPYGFLAEWSRSLYFIPCLSAVLCGLMISNVPLFSFKFKKGQSGVLLFKRIAVLGFAALSIAACLVSGLSISLAVIVTVLTYIILALF
jgi:CDP-diacylglycerol--serine O-phosphatidyltransferase